MDYLQFYPTPEHLARKAVRLFQSRITRLLEPNAGRADLLVQLLSDSHRRVDIDCIEIDNENVAVLKDKGLRVVGHDFLEYSGPQIYSHVLMNPPFLYGVQHVLKAYDEHLYEGELVAILNASAIRNASTPAEIRLASLINAHGSVEYIEQAFETADTKRTTSVEIALIYLTKVASDHKAFSTDYAKDQSAELQFEEHLTAFQELSLPADRISTMVTAFRCAVKAAKESVLCQVKAQCYANWMPKSLLDDSYGIPETEADFIKDFADAYMKLKERAWTSVIRSADVTSRLSSAAQGRLESQFQEIIQLEFTPKNIYGFFHGLVESQSDIQIEMICDVFDLISRFHWGSMDNTHYYQGWKSNTKHRVNAFKIMHTRFILPANRRDWYDSWGSSLTWDDRQMMADIDKVFAMLDCKSVDNTKGLNWLFANHWDALRRGDRMSSDYFDIRFYARAGTFHFYPRRLDLIEMLNRKVGRHRQWIPDSESQVEPGFWAQYEKADKVNKRLNLSKVNMWRLHNGELQDRLDNQARFDEAFDEALSLAGIEWKPGNQLETKPIADEPTKFQLPLLVDSAS